MAEGVIETKQSLGKVSPKDSSSQLQTDLQQIKVEQEQSSKVTDYLAEHLPASETRIEEPMNPACEVAVVVPAYRERENMARLLLSLARQEGVKAEQFEVIVVVNNPSAPPLHEPGQSELQYQRKVDGYYASLEDNQHSLALLRSLENGVMPEQATQVEEEQFQEILSSGLKMHAIDKASPGATLPSGEQNVGGARDRGVAEVIERYKLQAGHDGIIAQTDADCALEPDYIAKLLDTFSNPEVIGVTGDAQFEAEPEIQEMFTPTIKSLVREYDQLYTRVLLKSLGNKGKRPAKLTGKVEFFGASMASRAYAAAEVGGVPRIAGGEDPAFGEALQEIGTIVRRQDLIVHPLYRLSERTAEGAGHGQKLNSVRDSIEQSGNLTVVNPQSIPAYQEIVKLLQQHLDGDEDALDELTIGEDQRPILSQDDEDLLREFQSKYRSVGDLLDSPDIQGIKTKISARVSEVFPRQDVTQSAELLVQHTLQLEPELTEAYERNFRETMLEEQGHIARRKVVCERFFTLASPPNPDLTVEDTHALLTSHAEELGLDKDTLQQVENDQSLINSLLDLSRQSTSISAALEGMQRLYKDELTSIESGSNMYALVQLIAINRAHRQLQHST